MLQTTNIFSVTMISKDLYVSLKHYLVLFPDKPLFLLVCSTNLLKTLCEKEKLLVKSNFSFSNSVFYLFGEPSSIFIKLRIVICKLFWIWKSLKFLVWERVKLVGFILQRCFQDVCCKSISADNKLLKFYGTVILAAVEIRFSSI